MKSTAVFLVALGLILTARDPRAPQNLVPVGALEAVLTHRLGDREWIRRLLTAHLASSGAPGQPIPASQPIEVPA